MTKRLINLVVSGFSSTVENQGLVEIWGRILSKKFHFVLRVCFILHSRHSWSFQWEVCGIIPGTRDLFSEKFVDVPARFVLLATLCVNSLIGAPLWTGTQISSTSSRWESSRMTWNCAAKWVGNWDTMVHTLPNYRLNRQFFENVDSLLFGLQIWRRYLSHLDRSFTKIPIYSHDIKKTTASLVFQCGLVDLVKNGLQKLWGSQCVHFQLQSLDKYSQSLSCWKLLICCLRCLGVGSLITSTMASIKLKVAGWHFPGFPRRDNEEIGRKLNDCLWVVHNSM